MTACWKCGERNPERARFCLACGAELDRPSEAREERKIVSVLFVDLVGFTSRSDRADPEDVRDLLQLYHHRVKDQIQRFGGTVEKFIGDAVMAVFGAPVAHTDDPERAVRAGLRALEAVEEMNRAQPGWQLGARAAVTTGEAVVAIGSGHEQGEPLALGDVVNTASRLQASAPPGRLVVGEETYRATRDAIRYDEREPVEAKGKRDRVAAWLAVEPVTAPSERRMRATPLVGRDRELSLLQSVWERATAERRPHLLTVIGPPGIGKSRLSREFAALVEDGGYRAIRGRCLPYDTRDVYGAFAQQVKAIAEIFEQDSPETAREKLAGALSLLLPQAEVSEITRSLSLMLGLGLDPPADEQALLLFAARRLVERLGVELPTLLVFEDVHWADAGQLDLIEYVAAHARETPVVLLALARPEFREARPTWGSGLREATRLTQLQEPGGLAGVQHHPDVVVGPRVRRHKPLDQTHGQPLAQPGIHPPWSQAPRGSPRGRFGALAWTPRPVGSSTAPAPPRHAAARRAPGDRGARWREPGSRWPRHRSPSEPPCGWRPGGILPPPPSRRTRGSLPGEPGGIG
jgi:class 3 adenylate cyclase